MIKTWLPASLLALSMACLSAQALASGGAGGVGGAGGGLAGAGGLGDGGDQGGAGHGGGLGGGGVGDDIALADGDGDGYELVEGDCDDTDPYVHPEALETCNGRDDDCDGAIDEGVTSQLYYDADQDGWGDLQESIDGCPDDLSAYAEQGGDCNDDDPSSHPGAEELCDQVDNDCNGTIDDGGCPDHEDAGPTPSANLVAALLLSAWMGVSAWRRKRKLFR